VSLINFSFLAYFGELILSKPKSAYQRVKINEKRI